MRKLLLLLMAVGIAVAQLQAQTTGLLSEKVTSSNGSPIFKHTVTINYFLFTSDCIKIMYNRNKLY